MLKKQIVEPRRKVLRALLGGCAVALPFDFGWREAHAETAAFPDGLLRSRPEKQGVNPDAILAFLDDVETDGFELHSFMLWRHGHVIAEGWWSPYRADLIHMTHSLTKSVTACAVGLAIAEGRFTVQDKVISFFKEHLPPAVSDNLAEMTVQDLLTMRTGHAAMVSGSVWRSIKTSWIAEFFKIPVVYKPGTKFVYTSAATYMLSAIVTKTTGQSVADYLKPRLFDPLGIQDYQWDIGPEGISPGANGLSWKTSDSLKLGILHAQNGVWNGKQILPKEWVAAVQKPYTQKYGYQWWLGPEGAFLADGLFSQLSVVFPEQNAVLALTAGIPSKSGFGKLVFKHFPAAFSATALDNNRSFAALTERTAHLQLLPPVVRSSSPVARHVSGKIYQFPDNTAHVTSMQFTFMDAKCVFAMQDSRGTHTIQVGLREPIRGKTTITGSKLHHEYQPEIMEIVASGDWLDNRTFVMTWIFVESAFRDTVICRFEGPSLRFDRSVNVNSAATELPTLNGRMADMVLIKDD